MQIGVRIFYPAAALATAFVLAMAALVHAVIVAPLAVIWPRPAIWLSVAILEKAEGYYEGGL